MAAPSTPPTHPPTPTLLLAPPNPQDTGIARTRLTDQYYTRDAVAQACVKQLLDSNLVPRNACWLEPAAGTGAFLRALTHYLPQHTAIALDLHPKGPGIRQHDFLAWEPVPHKPQQPIVVFGNPPFGRKSGAANTFIRHATKFAQVVAFILPRSFTKPSMQHIFPPQFHLRVSTALPKNSFTVNDQPYDVPCIFQIWTHEATPRPIAPIITPHHFEYTRAPHRDPAADYDLALRRVGATAGTAHLPGLASRNPNTHYFINLLLPPPHNTPATTHTITRLLHDHINQQQHVFQRENTTGPRSISQQEFTAVINPLLGAAVSPPSPTPPPPTN
jgi:hypothetical protein